MNTEKYKEWAEQSGEHITVHGEVFEFFEHELENFVRLAVADAVAAEREACAKACDSHAERWATGCQGWAAAIECAEAIRARGQQ